MGAARTLRNMIGTLVSFTGLSVGVALADDYSDSWGPAIGSTLPMLEAPDQSGDMRTLDDLSGKRGLLLFLNRSADW